MESVLVHPAKGQQQWENHDTTNFIQVSPNPVNQSISITGSQGDVWVKIIDVLGNEVKKMNVHNEERISTQDLSNGVYFISIQTNGQTFIRRYVKE